MFQRNNEFWGEYKKIYNINNTIRGLDIYYMKSVLMLDHIEMNNLMVFVCACTCARVCQP